MFRIVNLTLKLSLICFRKAYTVLAWHFHNLYVLVFSYVFRVYLYEFHGFLELKFLKVEIALTDFGWLLWGIWTPWIDKGIVFIVESNDEVLLKLLKKLLSFKFRLNFIRICIFGSIKCHELILWRALLERVFPRSLFRSLLHLLPTTWIQINSVNSTWHWKFVVWDWILKS